MACPIYKSFRKLKRKGKAKAQKPAERRRVEDIYHMAANHIVTAVKEAKASVVVMEKLKNIREKEADKSYER
jgi:putative transposase